jgi:hypothetical protein
MDVEEFPLNDETINLILMHRDIHFGGQFPFMIEYYEESGKGVQQEFSLNTIRKLQQVEKKMEQNLAAMALSGPEAETVRQAKEIYNKLSSLYENGKEKNHYAVLIADLILTEDEDPQSEIEAIINEQADIVPWLIQIIRSEEFYNPLFPGYGEAPHLAIKCLERIGDKRAIMSLFELIGRNDVFEEESALRALKAIGTPAKEFLIKIVKSTPITEDNERAAISLINFKDDPLVSSTCFHLLLDPEIRKTSPLSTYLALASEGLQIEEDRQQFQALLTDPTTPSILAPDLKHVASTWKE